MEAVHNPAFLLFLPMVRAVHPKLAHSSRRRLYMKSDKSTKPSNGMPVPLSQSAPSSSAVGTGVVLSVAFADEFTLTPLHRRLFRESIPGLQVSKHGSILHITLGSSDAFVFPYGCLVIWGEEDDREFFEILVQPDALGLRPSPIVSCRPWATSADKDKTSDAIVTDCCENGCDPGLERLAISCALAQVIKLRALETSICGTADTMKHISQRLAETGKIGMSRKEISRSLGMLFMERYRYQLCDDILATPGFLRDNERYLPYYKRVERYLELRERCELLHRRVEVLQEFYKLIGDELTHQYSIGLEVAITAMIAFEILLSLLALAKQSFRSMFFAFALFLCISVSVWGLWVLYQKRVTTVVINKYPTNYDNSQQLLDGLPPTAP